MVETYLKISDCQCNNNNCNCETDYYALCSKLEVEEAFFPNPTNLDVRSLFQCNVTDNYDLVEISTIQTVCFFMDIGDSSYIATPVNNIENE